MITYTLVLTKIQGVL